MNGPLGDFLITLSWLLGLIIPLFLLVVWKNKHGGRFYSLRMDTQVERDRFVDDWGPEERQRSIAEDTENDNALDQPFRSDDSQEAPFHGMDGLEFVSKLQKLHAKLQRGEITNEEFKLRSRQLTQQTLDCGSKGNTP